MVFFSFLLFFFFFFFDEEPKNPFESPKTLQLYNEPLHFAFLLSFFFYELIALNYDRNPLSTRKLLLARPSHYGRNVLEVGVGSPKT
jgi:hypothetical protein